MSKSSRSHCFKRQLTTICMRVNRWSRIALAARISRRHIRDWCRSMIASQATSIAVLKISWSILSSTNTWVMHIHRLCWPCNKVALSIWSAIIKWRSSPCSIICFSDDQPLLNCYDANSPNSSSTKATNLSRKRSKMMSLSSRLLTYVREWVKSKIRRWRKTLRLTWR